MIEIYRLVLLSATNQNAWICVAIEQNPYFDGV